MTGEAEAAGNTMATAVARRRNNCKIWRGRRQKIDNSCVDYVPRYNAIVPKGLDRSLTAMAEMCVLNVSQKHTTGHPVRPMKQLKYIGAAGEYFAKRFIRIDFSLRSQSEWRVRCSYKASESCGAMKIYSLLCRSVAPPETK